VHDCGCEVQWSRRDGNASTRFDEVRAELAGRPTDCTRPLAGHCANRGVRAQKVRPLLAFMVEINGGAPGEVECALRGIPNSRLRMNSRGCLL